MDVTAEIRGVLRELLANATTPEPWTEKSLLWAFGVSVNGEFDPYFWSAAAPAESFRLRRKLAPIIAPFRTAPFYSPALAEMADHLSSLGFIGARHLQSRLAPVIGKSNIIGVAKFMTDVVQVKLGRMDNVPVTVEGQSHDLFFWNQDVKTMTVLEVCEFARDLTAARGAFRFEHIAAAFEDRHDGLRKELLLREILNEWSAVRWLDQPGYGVVIGASPIVGVVEHMLNAAWPRALSIENIAQGLRTLRAPPREITSARERLEEPVSGFVEDEVLLEALVASGRMRRVGRASVALKHKPESDYWDWRPVERDLIDYLRSVGGSASNRAIYQHFKTDKSVEPNALAEAMKALPYLHVPTMQSTALWHWAT